MNQPSLLTRLMGGRFTSLFLLLACSAIDLACVAGEVSKWIGLFALFIALQTLAAVGQVRRYEEWSERWRAMGPPPNTLRPIARNKGAVRTARHAVANERPLRRGRFVLAALLVMTIAISAAYQSDMVSAALGCVWFALCVYLAVRCLRRVFRRQKSNEQRAVTESRNAETPFVAWVMNRASSSSTRAEAERRLPEYSARLLTR